MGGVVMKKKVFDHYDYENFYDQSFHEQTGELLNEVVKPLKNLKIQTYDEGKEILWYRNAANQAITEISCIKDKPQDYEYTCRCGYELKSGFNLESIRCHQCEELMIKTYMEEVAKVV